MTKNEIIEKLRYRPNGVSSYNCDEEDNESTVMVISYLTNDGIICIHLYKNIASVHIDENNNITEFNIMNFTFKGINELISRFRDKLIIIKEEE